MSAVLQGAMRRLNRKFPAMLILLLIVGCDKEPSGDASSCEDDTANDALTVFKNSCYECHGRNGNALGGMNFVLDAEKLVTQGIVVPGDPSASLLYQYVSNGTMPFRRGPLPDDDVEKIGRWIQCGADAFDDSVVSRTPIDFASVLHSIRQDLEQRPAADRPFIRYFSFVNLSNNPNVSNESLDTFRNGLSELVNSLSHGPIVVVPQPIDERRVIYRIDLRDYLWDVKVDGRDLWELLLHVYPYGIYKSGDPVAEYIYAETGTSMPYVNADWFVFAGSEPPLYYDMLRLPLTVDKLKEFLGVDNGDASVSAGFVSSGVSTSNRVITRFEGAFGAFWQSADFASSVGVNNILEHPLPPDSGFTGFEYFPDAAEYIFSLPNGLHGFYISNGVGNRLDEAPTTIVFDSNDEFDPVIRSGRKCESCHVEGMISATDSIRDYVQASGVFPSKVVDEVRVRYPVAAEFSAALNADKAAFLAARTATGVPVGAQGNDSTPMTLLADDFQGIVDIERAAADLFISVDSLRTSIDASTDLRKSLGVLLLDDGGLKRETFQDAFPSAVCDLGVGDPFFINGEVIPCHPVPDPADPNCGCQNPDNEDIVLPPCDLSCSGTFRLWIDKCGILNYVEHCEEPLGFTCGDIEGGYAVCEPL